MKKIALIIILFVPLITWAQKNPVDKLFEKYANEDGFTTVNISGKLLGMAGKFNMGDPVTKELVTKLTGIRIITADKTEAKNEKLDFFKELEKEGIFKDKSFESLMEVTNNSHKIRFLGQEDKKGKLSELLLVVGGSENVLISIRGSIDTDEIARISKAFDIEVDQGKEEKSK